MLRQIVSRLFKLLVPVVQFSRRRRSQGRSFPAMVEGLETRQMLSVVVVADPSLIAVSGSSTEGSLNSSTAGVIDY